VTAVTRRTLGPDEAGPSSIFIRGGELEQVMRHFWVNECRKPKLMEEGLLVPRLREVLEPWVKGHESQGIIEVNGLEKCGG